MDARLVPAYAEEDDGEIPRRRPARIPELPGVTNKVRWEGRTSLKIKWGVYTGRAVYDMQQREAGAMIEDTFPVRRASAEWVEYTFRDREGVSIDLSGFASVRLLVKAMGRTIADEVAEFLDAGNGIVVHRAFIFTVASEITQAQFVAIWPSGYRLYGEPLQVKVVKNADDLTADEIMTY